MHLDYGRSGPSGIPDEQGKMKIAAIWGKLKKEGAGSSFLKKS